MLLTYIFWGVCLILVVIALVNRFFKSKKEDFNKRDN